MLVVTEPLPPESMPTFFDWSEPLKLYHEQ